MAFEFLGNSLPNLMPSAAQAGPTPTLDQNAPVPLKVRVRAESGLEMQVVGLERPLRVEGLANMPVNQQFILVSITARNTKTSGEPISLNPADFKVKGDGGLTYDANPPTVTIDTLLTPKDAVAPGKSLNRDLIFQIAQDDSGLMLYWKTGSSTRAFILEP
ncbi:MAG: DUF4352 domain-containing protein [Chloroflexi bacterium]|nr:DUF4352 domain-containing protein [Chloroflexota bacterium]